MMNSKQEAIVQNTLPLVAENLSKIIDKFYQILLDENPALKNVFNSTNQKTGLQSKSLANSIAVFAMNYSNLNAIQDMIRQIAHKHCSIGVTPEQYTIVGTTLLAAIDNILGDVVTEEIRDAWAAFYWTFADILIKTEKELYFSTPTLNKNQFKSFKIVNKIAEAINVFSLYLKPEDGCLYGFKPGQYVSVKVKLGEYEQIRQYSLSDIQNQEYIRITIKREENYDSDSIAVSNYIYDNLVVGDTLDVSAPFGTFVLNSSTSNITFISAGVGITPVMSMLKTLMHNQGQQKINFIYLVENSDHHIFKQELKSIQGLNLNKFIYYKNPLIRDIIDQDYNYANFDFNDLQKYAFQDMEYYVCASDNIINKINVTLTSLGIDKNKIHDETFQPDGWIIN